MSTGVKIVELSTAALGRFMPHLGKQPKMMAALDRRFDVELHFSDTGKAIRFWGGQMGARAPIDGRTLRWAREAMGCDRAELASTIRVTEQRIRAFELETEKPTLRQLEKLAHKLDRTPASFFVPPPAELDTPATVDFRGNNGEPVPPLLIREMKRAEEYRKAIIELDGAPTEPALAGATTQKNVREQAEALRGLFGLTPDFTPKETENRQVLAFWRSLVEEQGYLVFQTTRIPLEVFRGLSVYHNRLPIILLNGADSPLAKVFTIFHEIAHLSNRTYGLCVLSRNINTEATANAFSANFLMPEGPVRETAYTAEASVEALVAKVARTFKVSTLAAGVRLANLELITKEALDDVWRESSARWAKNRKDQRAKRGGPPSWRIRFRDLGPKYVGTVARALDDQRVDWLEASYLLDAKIPIVEQMFAEYHRLGGEW